MQLRTMALSDIEIEHRSNSIKSCRFGNVFFGTLKSNGLSVSCRIIPRNRINATKLSSFEKEKELIRYLMAQGSYENNIVPCVGFLTDIDCIGFIHVKMMFCLHTTFSCIASKQFGVIPQPILRHLVTYKRRTFTTLGERHLTTLSAEFRIGVAYDIASAVCYLHRNNISHGNIKSPAIFIDEYCHAKLHFFALARVENVSNHLRGKQMTVRWIAPEVLTEKTFDGKKADIYSLGVLFWQLETQFLPFGHKKLSLNILKNRVKKGLLYYIDNLRAGRPKSFLFALIYHCCLMNPKRRIEAFMICKIIAQGIFNRYHYATRYI